MDTWREHWKKLCNTDDDTVVCSLWASYAANAVKDNLNVTIMYNINNGITCSSLPMQTIHLQDTLWYITLRFKKLITTSN